MENLPKGCVEETCPICKAEGYERAGICEHCLRAQAHNKEIMATTSWVSDNRFRCYHEDSHWQFKSMKLRMPNERPLLYYGVELEVSFNRYNSLSTEILEEFSRITEGMFIYESDSSVSNGFEMISRPTSYAYWTDKKTVEKLRKGFKYLTDMGVEVNQSNGNGLHIHLSKAFFRTNKTRSLDNILKDMDWVFQYYQPEFEIMARRPYTEYCQSKMAIAKRTISGSFYNRMLDDCLDVKVSGTLKKGNMGSDHHLCVTNRNLTIEARVFKSTVDVEELLASIELMRNLAHSVRAESITNKTLSQILATKESPYLDKMLARMAKQNGLKLDRKNKTTMEVEL